MVASTDSQPTCPSLSLALPNYGEHGARLGLGGLVDLAQEAEDVGFDRVVVSDHIVLGNTLDYPWGEFATAPDAVWFEPLTTLTAIAARTSRIRLATGILIAPLRPAALLAKTVATLDQLSAGRVDLGVGTGWHKPEFDALGVSFLNRGQVLTNTVAACRSLWQESPASFRSDTISFDQTWCRPQPFQGRLPVWFAGTLNGRNLHRIVTLGDGWMPLTESKGPQLVDDIERLGAAWRAAGRRGRPWVQVRVTIPGDATGAVKLRSLARSVEAPLRAGATDVRVDCRRVMGRVRPADVLAEFRQVLDDLAS